MTTTVVYIHGVVPRTPSSHEADYRAFHRGLAGLGVDLPTFDEAVKVELWWEAAQATGNLAAAQNRLARLTATSPPVRDLATAWLVKPLRELFHFAWSDVFFYLSPEGEERTRRDVWQQLLTSIPVDEPVDLVVVCHSGGTLVAHDFLFYLFGRERDVRRAAYADVLRWENAEHNWRIRALVTLGSPLTPLMVRSASLVDRLAADPGFRLDPASLGLDRPTHSGRKPVWVNVWDVHDILSFPVAGLYRPTARILDAAPDVGDLPQTVHGAYWRHPAVHSVVAAALTDGS